MKFIELTMPLSHQQMPDEVLPTSVKFFLGPKDHAEKGIVLGSQSGTCLVLPSVFSDFRKTPRIDELSLEKLVLRPTTLVRISKGMGEETSRDDLAKALESAQPHEGDAILIATGWGDRAHNGMEGGGSYVLQSPRFSLAAATYLAEKMKERRNDLLLIDTPLLGWPGSHLIQEWCSLIPTPAPESGESRMYLHLYNAAKAKEDFAVDIKFAECGIMTVRKLMHCERIEKKRIRIIVSPLKIVRGVASTCRVVGVED